MRLCHPRSRAHRVRGSPSKFRKAIGKGPYDGSYVRKWASRPTCPIPRRRFSRRWPGRRVCRPYFPAPPAISNGCGVFEIAEEALSPAQVGIRATRCPPMRCEAGGDTPSASRREHMWTSGRCARAKFVSKRYAYQKLFPHVQESAKSINDHSRRHNDAALSFRHQARGSRRRWMNSVSKEICQRFATKKKKRTAHVAGFRFPPRPYHLAIAMNARLANPIREGGADPKRYPLVKAGETAGVRLAPPPLA